FNAPATTALYTLALHDALPIFDPTRRVRGQVDDRRRGNQGIRQHDALVVGATQAGLEDAHRFDRSALVADVDDVADLERFQRDQDRKSTRLNSSHVKISYAVFC